MGQKENICCENSNKSLLSGILYGLLPHSFCVAFIVFSIVGAVGATAFLKNFLLIPYFFHLLIFVSLLLATVSSAIYLRKNGCLCMSGMKSRWKYVAILYSSTILVNLLMFFVVFPALANMNPQNSAVRGESSANLSIKVQIPCSGHASLITDELKKSGSIQSVTFKLPDNFEIRYDPEKTSPEKIVALDVFKEFKATINQ